jgi:ribosomal protein S27E
MSEVVSLAKVREERQPHVTGTFVCVGCRHEWVGVAPLASRWVDCPECHLPQGTNKHPFGADEGDRVLVCADCGGEALTAYKRGGKFWVRCMGCGNDLTNAFYEG